MPLYQIFLHFWIILLQNAHNFDLLICFFFFFFLRYLHYGTIFFELFRLFLFLFIRFVHHVALFSYSKVLLNALPFLVRLYESTGRAIAVSTVSASVSASASASASVSTCASELLKVFG